MYAQLESDVDATGLRIGLAVSAYHDRITAALRDGAIERFRGAGGRDDDLQVVPAAGAFELVAIAAALAGRDDVDAVVALGCVITGETRHDRYIAAAVARGLIDLTTRAGIPVAFGLLTCASMAQAEARAGGDKGNKGAEAMDAAIRTANTIRALRAGAGAGGRG